MYILYGGPYTRALIVEMVLAEGDIAYELRKVDIVKQEHRSAEFLAINPAGRVPALITPAGEVLYETPAICLHLAEHHQLTQLVPKVGDAHRGPFLSGLFYLTGELEPAMKRYFYPHRYVFRNDDEVTMKQHALESGIECLVIIERRLDAAGPYHLGERFCLVDIILTYWNVCMGPANILKPFPAIRRCMELIVSRAKFRGKFETLATWADRYASMQARGEGVL